MGSKLCADTRGSFAICLTSLFGVFFHTIPQGSHTYNTVLLFPQAPPRKHCPPLHLERPLHCLGQSLTLSSEPLPTFSLFYCTDSGFMSSSYNPKCILWLSLESSMVCGFYFLLDIFRYFLFFSLQGYLSYNFLCKWKKQLSVLKKKMVVILCLSLLLCQGIVKARNQVFFVLSSKLRTYCVLVVCQVNE